MSTTNDNVHTEIEAFFAASRSARARNDVEAMVSMMTDDVVLLTAMGEPIVGREGVRNLLDEAQMG